MTEFCLIHPKVELILTWVFKSNGTKKLVKLCPKCHNLSNIRFTCSKCGWKNNLWLPKKIKAGLVKCERCSGTGKRGIPFLSLREIPNWRLNVDDTKPGEILETSPEAFGMKPKSAEEWKAHYENDYEKKKMEEFKKQKKEFTKETLGSPNFAIPKATQTS